MSNAETDSAIFPKPRRPVALTPGPAEQARLLSRSGRELADEAVTLYPSVQAAMDELNQKIVELSHTVAERGDLQPNKQEEAEFHELALRAVSGSLALEILLRRAAKLDPTVTTAE